LRFSESKKKGERPLRREERLLAKKPLPPELFLSKKKALNLAVAFAWIIVSREDNIIQRCF